MEPQQPTIVTSQPVQKPKGKGAVIALTLLVLLLLGVAAYLFMALQTSKDNEKTAKSQTVAKQKELDAVNAKLKTARDTQRKKDIALLANVINAYKAKNGGKFYTTEGTQSRKIFEDELAPQIKDFIDPTSGTVYGYEAIAQVHTPSPLKLGVIQYQWLGRCKADGDFEDTTSEAFAAIRTVLESGVTHCVDL